MYSLTEEALSSAPPETVFSVPQDLPGVWVSASEGQLMLTETITFYENGDLTVYAVSGGVSQKFLMTKL